MLSSYLLDRMWLVGSSGDQLEYVSEEEGQSSSLQQPTCMHPGSGFLSLFIHLHVCPASSTCMCPSSSPLTINTDSTSIDTRKTCSTNVGVCGAAVWIYKQTCANNLQCVCVCVIRMHVERPLDAMGTVMSMIVYVRSLVKLMLVACIARKT